MAAAPMSDSRGYLPFDKILSILEAAKDNPRDFLLLMTLAFTGRRVSEIVGLCYKKQEDGTWKYALKENTIGGLKPVDIVPDKNAAFFWILKKRQPSQRMKPIPSMLKRRLLTYIELEGIKPDERIFPLTKARVWQIVLKYADRAGIPDIGKHHIHPHIFRHSYSVYMVDRVGLKKLQDLLEHADIGMTAHYLQYSIADVEKDIEEAFHE